ncbi:MAG TPA: hypothetical protein VE057_20710 [Archangium sp.]|nr:hypothetical protein [Archangium sp.]
MHRPHFLPAVLLALGLCACGDPREDLVGGYPITGTMQTTSGGSTNSSRVKDYVRVSSDSASSDRLSVLLSGFKCTSAAKMTGPLEFSIERTQCPPETTDGCTYTVVLERGTGGKDVDYSELVIKFSGTVSARCTDGRTGQTTFSLSMSGFRSAEGSTERELEALAGSTVRGAAGIP